jgi:hypothetical protein
MASIGVGPAGFAPADVVVASLEELSAQAFDRLMGGDRAATP